MKNHMSIIYKLTLVINRAVKVDFADREVVALMAVLQQETPDPVVTTRWPFAASFSCVAAAAKVVGLMML
jgi:hypothetical protein